MSELIFLHKTQSPYDLILSGRSLIEIKNRTGPKTDPSGTQDKNGTASGAWPSVLIVLRGP